MKRGGMLMLLGGLAVLGFVISRRDDVELDEDDLDDDRGDPRSWMRLPNPDGSPLGHGEVERERLAENEISLEIGEAVMRQLGRTGSAVVVAEARGGLIDITVGDRGELAGIQALARRSGSSRSGFSREVGEADWPPRVNPVDSLHAIARRLREEVSDAGIR